MVFEDWLQDLREIAVEKFGFTPESAESLISDSEAWRVPFDDGDTPMDALIDDLANA